MPYKIAIIGSGISGLVCAYLLSREHEVHIFEACETLGGHTHTVPLKAGTDNVNIDCRIYCFQ